MKMWRLNKVTVKKQILLMVRYIISGLSGIIANLVVYTTLIERYDTWYVYAALAGFLAAYVVTFTIHKYWTFKECSIKRVYRQSWLYLCTAVSVLIINMGLLHLFVSQFNIHLILAQILSLGLVAGVSFIFTTQVTFHEDEGRLDLLRQGRYKYLYRILKKDSAVTSLSSNE